MLLLFYCYSEQLRTEKLFITLQSGENTWWPYHCVTAELAFSQEDASLLLNVPWRTGEPIKFQSTSLLVLTVFPLHAETSQEGKEAVLGERVHCSALQGTCVLEVASLLKETWVICPCFDGSRVRSCSPGFFQSFCNPGRVVMQFLKLPS